MKSKSYLLTVVCSFVICFCVQNVEGKNLDHQSANREDDLKVIIEQTFLRDNQFDKAAVSLSLIRQGIDPSELTIPVEAIAARIDQEMQSEEIWDELADPYRSFSDEELSELRQIFEKESFLKYSTQSFSILKANMHVMDRVLNKVLEESVELSDVSVRKVHGIQTTIQPESEILKITKDNFHEEVEESEKPVIIDVFASWCRPCQSLAPIFESLHEKYQEHCRFGKVDSDEEEMLLSFLKIKVYPTILFMHKGKIISREEGSLSKEKFEKKIKEFFKAIKEGK